MIDSDVIDGLETEVQVAVKIALGTLATFGVFRQQEEKIIKSNLLAFNQLEPYELAEKIQRDQEIIKRLRAIQTLGESYHEEQKNA